MLARMEEGPRTHRDTLAFALTIAGATLWTLVPCLVLMRDRAHGRELAQLATMITGATLGAWIAASVWRRVDLATAGVAGAIPIALMIGTFSYYRTGAISIELRHLGLMTAGAASAVAGAWLGRKATRARRPLAAAFVMQGTAVLGALPLLVLHAAGHDIPRTFVALLLLAIGASVGAILCGEVQPRAVAGRTFLIVFSMYAVMALDPHSHIGAGKLVGGGLIAGGFLAGIASIFTSLVAVRRERRAAAAATTRRPDLPPAKIVER